MLAGDWDSYNPSSSNVIYEEQSPSSSHSASPSEVCYLPVPGEALTRVQLSEKLERAENTVPEKRSTLTENQSEAKPQSSPRRTKNRWECPSRDRSASPEKLLAAEGHPRTGLHSPRKGDPEKTDVSLSHKPDSSRKSESKPPESGMNNSHKKEPLSGSQGGSASPQKHFSQQGHMGTVDRLREHQEGATGGEKTEQLKGGNGRTGANRKDAKQKTSGRMEGWSPEWRHAALSGNNLPFSDSSRNTSENEKIKKSRSGEPSSSRLKTSSLSDIPLLSTEKQRWLETQETVLLNRQHGERHVELPHETKDDGLSKSENSSPVKKTPITPGPWRVPSACKVTHAAAEAEKRV